MTKPSPVKISDVICLRSSHQLLCRANKHLDITSLVTHFVLKSIDPELRPHLWKAPSTATTHN